jgi:hypothetical protein
MDITEAQLRALIAGQIVGDLGDVEAYKNGSRNLVKGFLRDTVDGLRGIHGIETELENSNYGSGVASYWDVFCYSKSGVQVKGDRTHFEGLGLYLCCLAPVAVLGAAEKTRTKNSGSGGFLRPDELEPLPQEPWVQTIRAKLEKRGFVLPSQKFLRQPLPFAARVPTILASPPYTMFDVFFHWED